MRTILSVLESQINGSRWTKREESRGEGRGRDRCSTYHVTSTPLLGTDCINQEMSSLVDLVRFYSKETKKLVSYLPHPYICSNDFFFFIL